MALNYFVLEERGKWRQGGVRGCFVLVSVFKTMKRDTRYGRNRLCLANSDCMGRINRTACASRQPKNAEGDGGLEGILKRLFRFFYFYEILWVPSNRIVNTSVFVLGKAYALGKHTRGVRATAPQVND